MAFTYTDPGTSNRDWVRWRVGDTDSTDPLQTDAEVAAALATYGSKFKAAAAVARAIAAKFSRKADTTMDQFSVSHSQKAKAYLALADEIEAGVGLDAGRVGSIQITNADRDTERDDTERPSPAFASGMFSEVIPLMDMDSEST
ncbi:MAG: hypothetical protein WC718_07240 [Phycisphaerales bacterium]|jgi:hypothetical protein